MRIPDPIEQGEARIERWADVHIWGDQFTCQCGKQCELHNGIALSPDPNCIPVCSDCAMKCPVYAKWCSQQAAKPK